MNITKAKYVIGQDGENQSITATINDRVWSVPIATNNTDYQAIQEWVAEGNTIEDAD